MASSFYAIPLSLPLNWARNPIQLRARGACSRIGPQALPRNEGRGSGTVPECRRGARSPKLAASLRLLNFPKEVKQLQVAVPSSYTCMNRYVQGPSHDGRDAGWYKMGDLDH
eukprot:gene25940-biopygen11998